MDAAMTEEWRAIPTYEGRYEASTLGRIRSLWAVGGNYSHVRTEPLVLKASVNAHGYFAVNLSGENRRPHEVHRLVCLAFHGPQPSAVHTAAHRDGHKPNCRADNLRWATWAEQAADRKQHGTARGNPLGRCSAKQRTQVNV